MPYDLCEDEATLDCLESAMAAQGERRRRGAIGIYWDLLGSVGIHRVYQNPSGSIAIYGGPSGSIGIYWDLFGSVGIHRVYRDPSGSIGSIRMHWDPLGSIEIHWDLLRAVGIYLDPLGPVGIHRDTLD